ncbi:MAG: hypothetical protein H6649_06380 [Caldilineae bacterium]|nr:hypothetical protein [Anaerolineae bacterium]MCB0205896.1 hypothetical protein [Anaerolineae bacterium]MCB0255641.1 hypothetical protein [Anaerolineae bacterium]MCB9153663.1 hypothetical protein [Caldilineae bacterium]
MHKRLVVLLVVLALLVAGCGGSSAQPTQAPVVEPTATTVSPTNTPVPPTDTAVPPTDTPVAPTDTPVPPTDTPVPPTATSAPATEEPTEEAAEPTEEPVEPTEEPAGGVPTIPHAVVGIETQCLTCHGPNGVKPVPADHEGRTVDTCTMCHVPEAGGGAVAPGIPHAIVGMEGQCLTCHGESGVKPAPADHEGRPVDTCTTCHQPQS